jgi:di/tricarboxylate transporter
MSRLTQTLAVLICIAATAVFFWPPPAGVAPVVMHAAALMLLTVGLWATAAVPEYVTSLLFFLLAVVLAIASPTVVFSSFASATMWLVLGGLLIAEAVGATGLGRRVAGVLFDRFTGDYVALMVAVAGVATVLAFFMPATVARMLLLLPIVVVLAERVGFAPGSRGYNGLCMMAIMVTYQSGSAILPANAPNLVLAGATETLYSVQLIYTEYLWVMFPVLALLKGAFTVALIIKLFPATVTPRAAPPALPAMSAAEKRLAVVLSLALLLWLTDALHGVRAGWVALAAGLACLMPRIGVLPPTAFNEVKFGPFFYVGASIGLGAVVHDSGLGDVIGNSLRATLDLQPGADFTNFMYLSVLNALVGVLVTNPAMPAISVPLAAPFAEAAGWPLVAAIMTIAVGYNVMFLPYQVPPVVVGMYVCSMPVAVAMRVSLPLAAVGLVVFMPLEYLWWRLIGYFG